MFTVNIYHFFPKTETILKQNQRPVAETAPYTVLILQSVDLLNKLKTFILKGLRKSSYLS